jgi:hypothetical protein
LKVSEKRVLKGIFEPTSEEVRGGWRKVHNEELHNLHSSQVLLGLSNQGE